MSQIIWFKQGENWLQGCCCNIPDKPRGDELLLFTNSNWGPQDTSKPLPNETRTVCDAKLKLIQCFSITHIGGLLYWGVHCKKVVPLVLVGQK